MASRGEFAVHGRNGLRGDEGSCFKGAAALSFRAGLSPRLPVSSVKSRLSDSIGFRGKRPVIPNDGSARERPHEDRLAVVAGNARARAFYERCGWRDAGPVDYTASSENGPVSVPCQRYAKRVQS